jgi:hypothetical protein
MMVEMLAIHVVAFTHENKRECCIEQEGSTQLCKEIIVL